jgi:ATP-dependent RNA helicase RhlE
LDKQGIGAMAIHGNKSQSARERALASFKANKIRVLVATDIAARGLDIADLPHVVNYELPNIPEDYVHRIGRTGRAGKAGSAVSLVSDVEEGYLWDIEKTMKKEIPLFKIDDRGEKIAMPRPATRSKLSRPAPGQQQRRGGGGGRQGGGGGKGRPQGGRGGQGGRSSGGRPQGGGRSGGSRPQGGGRASGGRSAGSSASGASQGAASSPSRPRKRNR